MKVNPHWTCLVQVKLSGFRSGPEFGLVRTYSGSNEIMKEIVDNAELARRWSDSHVKSRLSGSSAPPATFER